MSYSARDLIIKQDAPLNVAQQIVALIAAGDGYQEKGFDSSKRRKILEYIQTAGGRRHLRPITGDLRALTLGFNPEDTRPDPASYPAFSVQEWRQSAAMGNVIALPCVISIMNKWITAIRDKVKPSGPPLHHHENKASALWRTE